MKHPILPAQGAGTAGTGRPGDLSSLLQFAIENNQSCLAGG